MSEFYHDLVTQKSFDLLQGLRRKFDFILIGGWAVYLYTKALKSKDIDIVVDFGGLAKLKEVYTVIKNDRLKKYEFKFEQFEVDIYLPEYSQLGFPVKEIFNRTRSIEGFVVPKPEILLILKAYVAVERKGTSKGKKDLIDIFSLLKTDLIDWQGYDNLVKKFGLSEINHGLKSLISAQVSLPEIGISRHSMARLKRKILSKN